MKADRTQAPTSKSGKPDADGAPDRVAPRAPIETTLPEMTPAALGALHANALRLQDGSVAKLKAEAERLLPFIEAELETRRAAAPPPKTRKTARAKTASKA